MGMCKILFCKIIVISMISFLCSETMAQENSGDSPEFVIEEEILSPDSRLPTYTWNQFLNGEQCDNLATVLKEQDFLSPEQDQLLKYLSKYCIKKGNVWASLLGTFRQNKKALLINEASKEKSFFINYLFRAFYSLIDIHKLTPTGKDTCAQLDKIENAIHNKNLEQIVNLLQTFSTDQIVFLTPFSNEITQLVQFKKSLGGKS